MTEFIDYLLYGYFGLTLLLCVLARFIWPFLSKDEQKERESTSNFIHIAIMLSLVGLLVMDIRSRLPGSPVPPATAEKSQ